METKYLGVTYDRTKAMDIPEEQFKLCKEANGQFCPLLTPLQPLTNPPSCVAALYTKNSREIDRLCELTTRAQPVIYLPIPLTPNVWAIISSPFRQQPPVTVICPTKPATLIHISPPIHVYKVAAWKPPALTGFLSLCRKDKNNTKMDGEDMDGPVYQPSGIIPTVIRPQESHGLCVIPQPSQKKDHR